MTVANFLAYAAQVGVIVIVCAGLPRLLGLRAPAVQYVFWRVVLLVCLALPFVQPWRSFDLPAVSAGTAAPAATGAMPAAMSAPFAVPPAADVPFDWPAALRYALVAGAAVRLIWIAIGVVRLNALRRRTGSAEARGFDDLQAAIGTRAPILWSAEVRHPVTFGLLEPVVLLPAALRAADPAAQRAVVAHELTHVKRRDWAWVLGEEVVRAIFWFHPAIWWLISRVQLARETVVDELSILVTNARRTYLDTLLAFSDDGGLRSSPAFSARRHLFHRVMLLSKEGEMSSSRVAIASGVLIVALAAGTWTAVGAFPLYAAAQAQTPPRDPLSPAAYHRQGVEMWERAQRDATLTPEQKLDVILKGIAAEDRALALNPNYVEAMIYKSILLRMQAGMVAQVVEQVRLTDEADRLRVRALELRQAQGPPPVVAGRRAPTPPPPPPPPPAPITAGMSVEYRQTIDALRPLRIGGQFKPPAKLRDVKPLYPPEAQVTGVQGVVIIEAIIDASGQVAATRVLRSIPMLDAAAVEAVGQWLFTPSLVNGVPTAVMMTTTVNFRLQ